LYIARCLCPFSNVIPYVPVANIVVCERNKDETKLLIGCENGTLVSQVVQAYTCTYIVHVIRQVYYLRKCTVPLPPSSQLDNYYGTCR
jgi:hypothetical protein